MVRIKHRYLLVNILYPDADGGHEAVGSHDPKLPAVVDFRRPSPSSLNAGLLVRHIRDHVELLYGDYGAGVTGSGLTIKYFSQATSTFIVRCPREHFRLIWAALTFVTRLPKSDSRGKSGHSQSRQPLAQERACIMRVVRVSGTIRKSEEEAIKRARADILRARTQISEGDDSSTLDAIFGTENDLDDVPGIEDDDSGEDEDDDMEI